jgi:hypothetical protein
VKRLIVAACVLALVVAMGCERVVDLTRAPEADAGSVDASFPDAFEHDGIGDGFNIDDGNNDGGIATDVGGPSDV